MGEGGGYRWIGERRRALGLTQQALAARTGISRTYLSNLERGVSVNPSAAIVGVLAGVLGAVDVDESVKRCSHVELSLVVGFGGEFRGLLCEDCGRYWRIFEIREALGSGG